MTFLLCLQGELCKSLPLHTVDMVSWILDGSALITTRLSSCAELVRVMVMVRELVSGVRCSTASPFLLRGLFSHVVL